jgi:hypothetical protein
MGPGHYRFGQYVVERHASGWRWVNTRNLASGGEWRRTRREAVLDLMAYLDEGGR